MILQGKYIPRSTLSMIEEIIKSLENFLIMCIMSFTYTKKLNIKPLFDNVLVKPLEAEAKMQAESFCRTVPRKTTDRFGHGCGRRKNH